MLPEDRKSLKEALQKIQREERYKERNLRRETRTYLSPRTAPPPPSSPSQSALFKHEKISTQNLQLDTINNLGISSILELEKSKFVQHSLPRTSTLEKVADTGLNSQGDVTPLHYSFPKPQSLNFDFADTTSEPTLEYLKETWIQPNRVNREGLISPFEGSSSNLEDPEGLFYLETIANQFDLDSELNQIETGLESDNSNSDISEEESVEQFVMAQRPLNLVHLPQYFGQAGTDPDAHVSMFNVVCAANLIPEAQFLVTFPATLYGVAQEWYQTHRPFANWDALRDAFLTRFRPLAFTKSLQERLRTIRMAVGESVDNYYGRMEYILQRWRNHGIPDAYLTGIFVGGLYPPEFKIAIKEKNPRDLATALQYAKRYTV